MSIDLDPKIRLRFDELIEEGNALCSASVEGRENRYTAWSIRALAFLKWFFNHVPGSSDNDLLHLFELNQTYPISALSGFGSAMSTFEWIHRLNPLVQQKITVLRSLRDSYVNGDYDNLEARITSHVLTSLMDQAEALLGEGIDGQFDHVPAAVLCGAVLEDALRRLCLMQSTPIEIVKQNGQKKTMEPLIQDLQKGKLFNQGIAADLRAWARIRNYAAHGEFNEFSRDQVGRMLSGVKQFLAQYLQQKGDRT